MRRCLCSYATGVRRWLPVGLIGIAVCAALGAYATFGRSNESESKIRGQLDDLAEAVRIDEGELSPLARQKRVGAELGEIFTEEASATIEEAGEELRGRPEIVAAAVQLITLYQSADVVFERVSVRIDPSGERARATAVAALTGAPHGEPRKRDERRVTFQLSKIKGDWKVTSAIIAPGKGAADGEGR